MDKNKKQVYAFALIAALLCTGLTLIFLHLTLPEVPPAAKTQPTEHAEAEARQLIEQAQGDLPSARTKVRKLASQPLEQDLQKLESWKQDYDSAAVLYENEHEKFVALARSLRGSNPPELSAAGARLDRMLESLKKKNEEINQLTAAANKRLLELANRRIGRTDTSGRNG